MLTQLPPTRPVMNRKPVVNKVLNPPKKNPFSSGNTNFEFNSNDTDVKDKSNLFD